MTDDLRELERRLEEATASPNAAADGLDADTAALRAGWLALGELLETTQPAADVQLPPMPLPPAPRRTRWAPVALAALAASLLVALTATWCARGTKPVAPLPTPSPEIAGNAAKPSAAPIQQKPVEPDDVEIAWDDSLDEEFAQASQAITQARQDWLATATTWRVYHFESQLENVKKDLDANTL